MLGLGSSIAKPGKIGKRIVRDGLVLKHDYNAGAVEPCSTGAASFTASANDYITAGTNTSLNPADGSFSISCWVNSNLASTASAATGFIVGKGDSTNTGVGSGTGFALYLGDSGTDWVFWVSDGSDRALSQTSTPANANQWYHLCGTFDTSGTDTAKLYVDGVLIASNTQALNTAAVDNDFTIGRLASSATSDWDGYICNVGFWKGVVLTQPQVKSIMLKNYAALSASEKTGLSSWWNLDSVIDSVGASTAVYDNHYAGGSKLGTELVTDGSFANGLDSWTSANVTLSGSSVILYDDDADYVFQSISYTDGEVYAFTFEGTGNVQSRIGYTGAAATQIPLTLPATIYRLVDSDASRVQVYGASDDSPATLTSVSVKLVNGNTGTLS